MTASRHTARHRHLRICREDAWGLCPAAPVYQCVPVLGDGLKTAPVAARFSPQTLFGGWRRCVLLAESAQVRGTLVAAAWPQVTALLLDMALDRTDGALASYCLQTFTPAGSRRQLGMMVDTLEIVAPAEAGDVELRLGLIGRAEEAAEGLSEADFDYDAVDPVPFGLRGARIAVDGVAVASAGALRLRVDNGLDAGPALSDGAPAFLFAGPRSVALELTKADDGAALREALRGGAAVSFEAGFMHPAGHTLSLALPRLYAASAEDCAAPGTIAEAVTHLEATADDAGDDLTWSLVLNT
jgi:hypothetical protein